MRDARPTVQWPLTLLIARAVHSQRFLNEASLSGNPFPEQFRTVHGTGAGRDKMGDYRNVAEAAYCTALATADGQVVKIARKINPELLVLTFETLGDLSKTHIKP
jgi:hypothetical protein